jgi:Tol biopolymer transport system component
MRIGSLVLMAALIAPALRAQVEMIGAGVISTPDDEFAGTITPDGRTMYFNKSIPKSYIYVIFESHLDRGSWSAPRVVPWSGRYRDPDPMLSIDGKRLFFASDRPVEGKPESGYDLWVVDLGARPQTPRNLGAPVNAEGSEELFASEAADGTLYFTSTRAGGQGYTDIYRSRLVDGKYQAPENLGAPVNAAGVSTVEALTAPDQSYLIIGAFGRVKGNPNDSDLFVSMNENGRWTEPRTLGPLVNTPAREYSPRFSADGQWLIFSSERGLPTEQRTAALTYDELALRSRSVLNGVGNIYRVPLSALGLPPVKEKR